MDVWFCRNGGGFPNLFLLLILMILCFCNFVANASFNVTTLRFNEGYSPLFGDGNLVRSPDGKSVRLLLDRFTGIFSSNSLCLWEITFLNFRDSIFLWMKFSGSGFISSKMYNHGFFSARIKLPSDYTAGIVVAFYVSIEAIRWSYCLIFALIFRLLRNIKRRKRWNQIFCRKFSVKQES